MKAKGDIMRHLPTRLVIAILAALPVAAAAAADTDALKKACHDDYQALCASVMPGGGRIIACLHQHETKLSSQCHAALQAK